MESVVLRQHVHCTDDDVVAHRYSQCSVVDATCGTRFVDIDVLGCEVLDFITTNECLTRLDTHNELGFVTIRSFMQTAVTVHIQMLAQANVERGNGVVT
ncbi:hypothetical protein D3C76_991020 [compost metagenome]